MVLLRWYASGWWCGQASAAQEVQQRGVDLVVGGNGLIGDDACGGGAGGQRDRGGSQFGQVAAVHGELAGGADLAFIDVQEPSIGAQPGIDRADGAGGADLAFIDVQEPSIGAQPGIDRADGAGGADRGA